MKPSDVSPLGFGVRARHLEPTPLPRSGSSLPGQLLSCDSGLGGSQPHSSRVGMAQTAGTVCPVPCLAGANTGPWPAVNIYAGIYPASSPELD